jgi:hypothetical protein
MVLAGPELAPHHPKLTMLQNVTNDLRYPLDEGAHHRGTAGALTCATPLPGNRFMLCADLPAGLPGNLPNDPRWQQAFDRCTASGPSIDQVIARGMPLQTRLRSIELGPWYSSVFGGGANYTPAYVQNVSWFDGATPLARRTNPRLAFDSLFAAGAGNESAVARAARLRRKQSVIDAVRGDAQDLHSRLGPVDRRRIDEYFTGVRELELRLQNVPTTRTCVTGVAPGEFILPNGFEGWANAMLEVVVLALRCDVTRVASFMLGGGGNAGTLTYAPLLANMNWTLPSGLQYPLTNVPHHDLSHWEALTEGIALTSPSDRTAAQALKYAAYGRIAAYHAGFYGRLLTRLQSVVEPDGSPLLDHCVVQYVNEISDGNAHALTELPLLFAGGAASGLTGNRVIDTGGSSLASIYLALARSFGVQLQRFGTTGTTAFPGLFA